MTVFSLDYLFYSDLNITLWKAGVYIIRSRLRNLILALVCKPNTDFGRFPKLASTQRFMCFPFHSKVFFANMDDATTVLLRKSFLGVYSTCLPNFAEQVLLQES